MADLTILKGFHQGDRVVVTWRRFTYEATIQSICPQFIIIHNMVDLTDGKREKMDYPSETISVVEIRKIRKAIRHEEKCRWDLKKLWLVASSDEESPPPEKEEPQPTVEDMPNIRLIAAADRSLLKAVDDLSSEFVVGVDFSSTATNTLLISVAAPHAVYIFDIDSMDDKIPDELAEWFGQRDCIKAMLVGSDTDKKTPIRVNALFDILVAYQKVTGNNKERSELKDIAEELLGMPASYFRGPKQPSGRPLSKDTLQSLARRAAAALKLYDHLEERLLRDSYEQHGKFSHNLSRQKAKFEQLFQPVELYKGFPNGKI